MQAEQEHALRTDTLNKAREEERIRFEQAREKAARAREAQARADAERAERETEAAADKAAREAAAAERAAARAAAEKVQAERAVSAAKRRANAVARPSASTVVAGANIELGLDDSAKRDPSVTRAAAKGGRPPSGRASVPATSSPQAQRHLPKPPRTKGKPGEARQSMGSADAKGRSRSAVVRGSPKVSRASSAERRVKSGGRRSSSAPRARGDLKLPAAASPRGNRRATSAVAVEAASKMDDLVADILPASRKGYRRPSVDEVKYGKPKSHRVPPLVPAAKVPPKGRFPKQQVSARPKLQEPAENSGSTNT